MEYRGLKLDPFQQTAIQAIKKNQSVIVAAPTGAGKTLIAEYALEKSLNDNKRIVYTAPIKALSNQKFRDFSDQYGDRVGVVTGDVTINANAQALIMTTEIFRNKVLDEPGALSDVSYVIFDEVHYLDDEERGTVWEESIIFAPKNIKILALSATIPNLHTLKRWIKNIRNDDINVIEEHQRPVPLRELLYIQDYGVGSIRKLKKITDSSKFDQSKGYGFDFKWRSRWKNGLIDYLIEQDQLPCLNFLFNRKDCESRAEDNTQRNLLSPKEAKQADMMFAELCRKYDLSDKNEKVDFVGHLIRRGVAFHHAGMLPVLKEIVEQLFTSGLIKLLFATETFAVGVNMPARSVIFDNLVKFDGKRRVFLKSREYQQMAGRAGRRSMDKVGYVYSYVQKPYIKPNFVERIIGGDIEPVKSQFNLSYSCILNLYDVLKDNIYEVCDKSLSNFQKRAQERQQRKRKGRKAKQESGLCFAETVNQVRRKIKLLEKMDYIYSGKLTRLGNFARNIFGYELVMTELYNKGLLSRLTPDELNIVSVAVVFESKRRDRYEKLPSKMIRHIKKPVMQTSSFIYRNEKRQGILELSKDPDFKLSGAAYAWSGGAEFKVLAGWASTADGDIIRTFRLASQVLHQLERAYGAVGEKDIINIREAIYKLKRDEVDAEKYLRTQ